MKYFILTISILLSSLSNAFAVSDNCKTGECSCLYYMTHCFRKDNRACSFWTEKCQPNSQKVSRQASCERGWIFYTKNRKKGNDVEYFGDAYEEAKCPKPINRPEEQKEEE